jgi:hypothetical protein
MNARDGVNPPDALEQGSSQAAVAWFETDPI